MGKWLPVAGRGLSELTSVRGFGSFITQGLKRCLVKCLLHNHGGVPLDSQCPRGKSSPAASVCNPSAREVEIEASWDFLVSQSSQIRECQALSPKTRCVWGGGGGVG